MSNVQLAPLALQQFNQNGAPVAGGQLFTYAAGTSNPIATYTDSTGLVQNANPIILDANGQASIWLLPTVAYKFVLSPSTDTNPPTNPYWTVDNITTNSGTAVGNMTDEKSSNGSIGFVAGVDFTDGTSTTLTLSQNYGSSDNLWVTFDAAAQGNDTFTLGGANNRTLTFNAPIPGGVQKVYVKGGTALTISAPAAGTVTDSSVATSSKLFNRIFDEVDVKDFGATGNGTTDDSAAIQAAINSGATRIHIPAGTYLVKTPLNFTNRGSVPLVIYGDGAYYQQSTGTTLLFQTGTWMADMTGCQFLHLEHMRWYSNGAVSGFSTMGLLYARSTVVNFAILNSMYKMIIELPSSTGSAVGSVAVANNCAENFVCEMCWFVADAPYATTLANELNFSSIYATVANTTFSNTDKTFRQCVFQPRNNFACVFYGEADATFDQCNWAPLGAVGAGVNAAMIFNASAAGYQKCSNLRFTGDFESFPAIAYFPGNTQDIRIDCTESGINGSAYVIPFNNTTHDGLFLKVNNLSGSVLNLIQSTGAGVVMYNAEIYMSVSQQLLDGNLNLQGAMVYGGANDLSNSAVLSVNSASSFRATYANSTLRGSVVWNPGGITTAGTVFTNISVPGAVVGSSVKVLPPYSLQACIASASVSAPGNVLLALSNVTGATVTFASGTWQVEVNKLYA